nr:putative reverse transcriptase domain-containing protein [Tanacetum cinerariifolium]
MIAGIKVEEEIIRDLERLDIELYVRGQHGYWASMRVEPDLISRIKEAQKEDKAHSSPFSIHPGSTKMYHDLKQHFCWSGMKGDVAMFVSKCLICQQVKIEHQWASGLLQPLNIPVWKWDEISMDFVTGLPRIQRRHDSIWVVVDRLTKSAHFLPIRKDSLLLVKIEHQWASGLLQPLNIPVWKWDEISMDFVTGLPRIQRRHDSIWVVVDRLT